MGGGEEFLVLLPETDLKGGELMSERVREKISKETLNFETQSTNITMSFGVTSYHNPEEIEECIKRADENLYSAKEGGRNQVVSGQ